MLLAKSWFVKAVLVENESDYRIILLQRKTFIVHCQLKKTQFWPQVLVTKIESTVQFSYIAS